VTGNFNIVFSGVGGQGILLASEITADAVISSGLDVKKSEVHGMAQRGGSVVAHLRFGKKVYSPLIEAGTADIQVAFEMLESLRYLALLKPGGAVIVNTQKIPPLSVSTGILDYPADVPAELRDRGFDVYPVDALEVARAVGEVRTVNIVLMGAMSRFLPVTEKVFLDTIRKRVKPKFVDVNLEAFRKGREMSAAPVA